MLSHEDEQISFADLDVQNIIEKDDVFRPLSDIINFKGIMKKFRHIYSEIGAPGYPIESGLKCLLVQVWLDKSDRELEDTVRFDIRIRKFCGFSMVDRTPDHTFFGRFRQRLGVDNIEKIHNYIIRKLKNEGIVRGFCSFIDTSDIRRKENTWTERDKKIEEELEKQNLAGKVFEGEPLKKKSELKNEKGLLTNKNVANYSADPDARIGCKGNDKFWFGYKRGVCVDGALGIITKVLVEPGNVNDWDMASPLMPESGAVLMDKGFDVNKLLEAEPEGVSFRIIKKRNRKDKNRDFDRWISRLRSPFEAVFSQLKKKTRYVGLAKNRFKGCIEAIAYNLKKVLKAVNKYQDRLENFRIA